MPTPAEHILGPLRRHPGSRKPTPSLPRPPATGRYSHESSLQTHPLKFAGALALVPVSCPRTDLKQALRVAGGAL